ncbi:hypothetical protein ACH4SP_24045 [Streptomyces sp. NPDC021093]|uniref:hypothetical protein n=1 Tax=Streptomyces sp. NPDC021093 TaxID=3365112 RepID=UPI00379E5C5F
MNYTAGAATGIVAGGATLAATGASSSGQILLAASVALVLGSVATYVAALRRRRLDTAAATGR